MKRINGRGPKDKGRGFENEIVASILAAFTQLTANDVRARSMGDHGVDIMLSEAALKIIPLAIECKRVGRIGDLNLPAALLQAQHNIVPGTAPAVVYREDRHRPMAALWLEDLASVLGYPPKALPPAVVSIGWDALLKIFRGIEDIRRA